MKYLKFIFLSFVLSSIGCAQTSFQLTQGFWEEEVEGFESYLVVENNYRYSIVSLEGEISVSKDWFGFYSSFEVDFLVM